MSPARLLRNFMSARREEAPPATDAAPLGADARQVLAYLLDHDAITTSVVGDIVLAARRHHLPAPRPAHRLTLASELCLQLVDARLLTPGTQPDTWTLPEDRS